ncbi:MAG: glycine C-acetyltransferase [Candidatus Latescibacteria bacterium]|nr:glycine C-acetyltransferase [Candidatus Latescibacterota bacterium]
MAYERFKEHLLRELRGIEEAGLRKTEREITSPQGSVVTTASGDMINLCANNYLGLADHPDILVAASEGLRTHGFGLASVRFICGTQDIHHRLERRISAFLGTEETLLYTSCFDANGGLFETLLGPEDAVFSDALNHASIIDGVRLCKATRHVFRHGDLADLEEKLKAAQDARFRLIATDGVFSMHGDLAPLPGLCDLADRHDALLMVDDSHATGFLGPTGRGTPEHFGVAHRIDILTSTLGKALGGASGGFTTGHREIIDLLRQRSRPYLFSNSVAPPIVCAALRGLDLISERPDLLRRLADNTRHFRSDMTAQGFAIREGIHPIVPIMIGDERRTVDMARALNDRGIFVVGFSYPVVPKGEARIRVQLSAAHTPEQIDRAVRAFTEVGREAGLIK